MIISIINRSHRLKDEQVQNAIRAINRQVAEDFEPYWSFGATLRLEGAVGARPDKQTLADLRGDAILYLWDESDVEEALGYHDANFRGIPYGFVFTELCRELGDDWTTTLSHEALELIGDAQSNLLVQGPHPEYPEREVFHWFEMCDAVQSDSYEIDGIRVSNFVLPLYFTVGEQEGGRNDFLGRLHRGKGLQSFGVRPGGYIGFYDPQKNAHDTYVVASDKKAKRRLAIKAKVQAGRGYLRKRGNAITAKEGMHEQVLDQGMLRSATTADPIRHVVVLMLENRSFDQMLGDATRIYPQLEGIPQNGAGYRNTSSKTGTVFVQKPNATAKVQPDPDHEHDHVMLQLGGAQLPPMGGFIDSYLSVPGATETNAQQVMNYFPLGATPAQDSLPALHGLARNFLVCDHWFSSMPGPTWPNRFFVHSGTSLGHVLMPSRQHPENMRIYNQDTIYDRLDDAGKNWRIYHDGIPQSIVLTHLLPKLPTSHYRSMNKFFDDVKDVDDFPDYVFIEPRYFSPNENDQHPPADVIAGDKLLADVYNALRNSNLWSSTLLIVTYDEHGGFYDHVVPPTTIAPDKNTDEYSFTQLGPRVPALLISPWVDAGVCKTPFEHTSILRYLCDKFGMPPLGLRAAPAAGNCQTQSFAAELRKRVTPRTDAPTTLGNYGARRRAAVEVKPSPVAGSREALLYYVASLPEDAPAVAAAPATIRKARLDTHTKLKAVALKNTPDHELRATAEQRFEQLRAQPSMGALAAKSPRHKSSGGKAALSRPSPKKAPRKKTATVARRKKPTV